MYKLHEVEGNLDTNVLHFALYLVLLLLGNMFPAKEVIDISKVCKIKYIIIHVFYKKKVYKKRRLKWSKSSENHEAQFPKFSAFTGQKSIFHRY